ncbi:Lrp/AsnC family transcriptional regulator [Halorubellus sp. PRR65]|uniref:siroheme decarboxylase subunit beta n=1 Tax=Halorubellus sp. PRR65 TaxID=3098148 RepID=UPI002B263122|nr:Lrp/AsnC family transcriptional regulator [Halorubellus sp. PRR65]
MSLEGDWRDRIDDVDARLIDEFQSDFPVERRPFRTVADAIGTDETDAFERMTALLDAGVFRRFGAVLNPPVIGSSTLAAVSAPDDEFDEIADVINGYRQVNHNYRRDHEWNMWFVVTAGSRERRDEILADIEARTGCTVLDLPMLTDYYIDLEFPVVNDDRFARESLEATDVSATRISESATGDLSAFDADLLLAIQDGFPVSRTPYCDLADALTETDDHGAVAVDDVLAAVDDLRAKNCIKRIGCVVNHVVTGFRNNCMVVWSVPDDELDARGEHVGALPYVTLCYHRPRRPDVDWEYNLFTMIHGRDADVVDAKIDELATDHLPYEHERLYSTETLKQTGAQYEDLMN